MQRSIRKDAKVLSWQLGGVDDASVTSREP